MIDRNAIFEHLRDEEAKRMRKFEEHLVELRKKDEELKAQMTSPDGIEGMVREGRTPRFFGPVCIDPLGRNETVIFCSLPPKTIQPGDIVKRRPTQIDEWYTPAGSLRGRADTLVFAPEQARALIVRMQSVQSNPKPQTSR